MARTIKRARVYRSLSNIFRCIWGVCLRYCPLHPADEVLLGTAALHKEVNAEQKERKKKPSSPDGRGTKRKSSFKMPLPTGMGMLWKFTVLVGRWLERKWLKFEAQCIDFTISPQLDDVSPLDWINPIDEVKVVNILLRSFHFYNDKLYRYHINIYIKK